MHYIKKKQAPTCFSNETFLFDENTLWNEFQNPCKTETKQYILEKEQENRCIYCERKVSINSTRLEHLKPQSKYPQERFNYLNLAVSCRGKDHYLQIPNPLDGYPIDSCDHYKDNNYDAELFLNPTVIKNIAEYFTFGLDDGSIKPSDDQDKAKKAKYMIETINLDNPSLRNERLHAKTALLKQLKKIPKEKYKKIVYHFLQKDGLAFISFLHYFNQNLSRKNKG